jgi:hypothetical protein
LFKQILAGFLLGDGWLEKRGNGVRLGISLTERFKDVAEWYLILLYGLGYTNDILLPLEPRFFLRKNQKTRPYYQIRTYSFASFQKYYDQWYDGSKKKIPNTLYQDLTPLCLAIWVMGDGSGIKDGGFKISSHSFTKEENQFLVDLLFELYHLESKVLNDGSKGLCYIRIFKRSLPQLKNLVMPYLLPSCYYKFRFVKQKK